MLYRVFIGGHEVSISKLQNPVVTREMENSGSFTFVTYDSSLVIVPMVTLVQVWRGSSGIIFNGRVLTSIPGQFGGRSVTCAGAMDWLNDAYLDPFTLESKTAEEIATEIISRYNNKQSLNPERQFSHDGFDIEGSSTDDYVSSNYVSARDALNTLVGMFGGYLWCTYVGDEPGGDITNFIRYTDDFGVSAISQYVHYGQNLISFSYNQSFADLYSCLIPIGSNGLTIKTVNDGLPYIESPTLVAKYGRIFKTVNFDAGNPVKLKVLGMRYLQRSVMRQIGIEARCVDLKCLNSDESPLDIARKIRFISEPHGIDEKLLCTKRTYNLADPSQDTVSLGMARPVFTRSSTKKIERVDKKASGSSSGGGGGSGGGDSYTYNIDMGDIPAVRVISPEAYAALDTYDHGILYAITAEEVITDDDQTG